MASTIRGSLAVKRMPRAKDAERTPALFILHPITREKLAAFGLYRRLEQNPRVVLRPRYDYFTFIALMHRSRFLVSDGGSNQEEAFYMGKPCLLLRKATERTEGLDRNVVLSKYDLATIRAFVDNPGRWQFDPGDFGVSPCDVIVDRIRNYAGAPRP